MNCLHRSQEPAARWFFQQLVIGLDYCHRKGVVNRDIKLENTLLQMVPVRALIFRAYDSNMIIKSSTLLVLLTCDCVQLLASNARSPVCRGLMELSQSKLYSIAPAQS